MLFITERLKLTRINQDFNYEILYHPYTINEITLDVYTNTKYLSVAIRRKAFLVILVVSSSATCLSLIQISTGILCFTNDLWTFFIETK